MNGPCLLVDIGNTRLKWALAAIGHNGPLTVHTQASDTWQAPCALDWFDAAMSAAGPTAPVRVLVSCVGPQAWQPIIRDACAVHGLPFDWVQSGPGRGRLINGYERPASLGVDRFCAALAVAEQFAGEPALLVSAGTATTVDAIDSQGRFLGGYILPGAELMASSLHRNTAQLPLASFDISDFPVHTEQAIATGIYQAQRGAVLALFETLHKQAGRQPRLILTGGALAWLKAGLPQAVECPDLVLQGLRWWARTTDA